MASGPTGVKSQRVCGLRPRFAAAPRPGLTFALGLGDQFRRLQSERPSQLGDRRDGGLVMPQLYQRDEVALYAGFQAELFLAEAGGMDLP